MLGLISELNPRRSGLVEVPREYNTWTFFRYRDNNRDLIVDMRTHSNLIPPSVTIPMEGASQLFIVPQPMRSTELISQDSREEPIQVISKPCDAGSVQYEASNAENVKFPISKLEVDEEVILSKSSIAEKSATKEPTRAGASNPSSPKHNQPRRQDQTGESSRMHGTRDNENKVLRRPLVPVSGEVSNSDDDLARSPGPSDLQSKTPVWQ